MPERYENGYAETNEKKDFFMILTTNRMILRPWREEDARALYECAKDPAVGPIAGWPPHASVEDSLNVIKTVLCDPAEEETFALTLKDADVPIGCVGLRIGKQSALDIADDEGEIGFWLGVPFWGQGLTTEAAKETIRYGFEEKGLSSIWSGYYDGNERSKRVQEKCGLRYRYTIARKHVTLLNEVRTEHVTCLTKKTVISSS